MNKKNFKIGAYIRVSTEEQAQNIEGSIKNQEERLKAHVGYKNKEFAFGEIVDTFIDRAKSGKDTNRPELQRLLRAIRNKKIDFVLVSELSRLSRSIKDFAEIWEMMRSFGCGFQSLRENFDTTTAAGEMLLYNMANLSQFERRQISERVSLNMNARAKRGLYNGGPVPLGYKLIEDKPGYLDLDTEHAETVKKVFEIFLKEGSLQPTAKKLNELGYKPKRKMQGGGNKPRNSFFTVDNVYKILTNQAYIGKKDYREKGEVKETTAVWKAIIDEYIFKKVQQMLSKNKSKLKPPSKNRHPYLLTGITFCDKCRSPLSGKSAWEKIKKSPIMSTAGLQKETRT